MKIYVHPQKPFGFVTYLDSKSVDDLMRRDSIEKDIRYNNSCLIIKRSLTKFQEQDSEFKTAITKNTCLRIDGLGVPDKEAARNYFNREIGEVEECKIREISQTKKTYRMTKNLVKFNTQGGLAQMVERSLSM